MFARLLASIFRSAPVSVLRSVSRKIGNALRRPQRLLADWVKVYGLSLVASCQEPVVPQPPLVAGQVSIAEITMEAESRAPTGPRSLGKFHLTFYYVIGEDEVAVKKAETIAVDSHDSELGSGSAEINLAAVAPQSEPSRVTLYAGGTDCQPIANVSKEFASEVEMQGTGKLHDGRIINIWGACGCEHSPCYRVTGNSWGNSGSGRPLSPFRTVAVDPRIVPLGTVLHIPALEGRRMPGKEPWGGFIHDGCVVADDTGGGIDGHQLDFFVGRKQYYRSLSARGGSHSWAKSAEVFDGSARCERKNGKVVGKVTQTTPTL